MKRDFKYGTPEKGGGYLLWRATLLWQRQIKQVLDPYKLTQVQFAILASILWLEDEKSKLSQQMIADYVGIEKMMTSEVLRTLEKKKLIRRSSDSDDGRIILISMEPVGRTLTQKVLRKVERADTVFLSPLKKDKDIFLSHIASLIESE